MKKKDCEIFYDSMEELAKERGIDLDRLFDIMDKGLTHAYKKMYEDANLVKVVFNKEKRMIRVINQMEVVDDISEDMPYYDQIILEDAVKINPNATIGSIVEEDLNPQEFGRIAASTARNTLKQEIVGYEREKKFEYFKEKENEMIYATVISDLEKSYLLETDLSTKILLPKTECSQGEEFEIGQRCELYVKSVEKAGQKEPTIKVTRKSPNIVKRLLEYNCPEIEEGDVDIVKISRDAGVKSKVCVKSNNPDIKAVSAILGKGNSRISSVVAALNGEKVEVFEYDENKILLVANSLSPVEVIDVFLEENEEGKTEAKVVVPDNKLSLAIGERGSNVRLSVQAIEIKIDILTKSQAEEQGIELTYNVDLARNASRF